MYKIKLIAAAQKDIDKLPSNIFRKIKPAIVNLAQNARPLGSMKLTQTEGYRIRAGDYRILYRIDESLKEIYIYRVKHRKEAYR